MQILPRKEDRQNIVPRQFHGEREEVTGQIGHDRGTNEQSGRDRTEWTRERALIHKRVRKAEQLGMAERRRNRGSQEALL